MNDVFKHMICKDGEPVALLEYAPVGDSDSGDAPLTSLVAPVGPSVAPNQIVDLACPSHVDLSCPSSIRELMAFFKKVKDSEGGEHAVVPVQPAGKPAVVSKKPVKTSKVPVKSAVKPAVKQQKSPPKAKDGSDVPNIAFLGSKVLPSGFACVSSLYL